MPRVKNASKEILLAQGFIAYHNGESSDKWGPYFEAAGLGNTEDWKSSIEKVRKSKEDMAALTWESILEYEDPSEAVARFGLEQTRMMYRKGINETKRERGVVKDLCLRYAQLEINQCRPWKARKIYELGAHWTNNPDVDTHYWDTWRQFEERHGGVCHLVHMLQERLNGRS